MRRFLACPPDIYPDALSSFHGLENSKTVPGPVFKRKQAEDWCTPLLYLRGAITHFVSLVFYEDQVIRRVITLVHQLGTPAAYQLTRRPYRVNWFINQLAMYVLTSVMCVRNYVDGLYTVVWCCGHMTPRSTMP